MDDLLIRGIVNIIPSKTELEKLYKSEKKLNVYFGIDPTATNIHLGHAAILRKLQAFATLGHNVTFLIGDFTALIGDSSDKDSERPKLTKEQIENNFETYKKQAEKILDFGKVSVKHNSGWLSKLSYEEILKLKQIFSLNDFISRELIKKRLDDGKRIGLDETEYPIMQGYDSYFMDTDLQIGGVDQIFNMQAGRTLQKNLRNKESYILTVDYLMGTDGRKMSKTWNNAIWLTDEPVEMFRKVMAINDDQILNYFILATNLSTDQIPTKDQISREPLTIKIKLAQQIVSELHSEDAGKNAALRFEKEVQGKDRTSVHRVILSWTPASGASISNVLSKDLHIFNSDSEAKRVIEQGGTVVAGNVVKDPNIEFSKLTTGNATTVDVGRKRFYTVKKK